MGSQKTATYVLEDCPLVIGDRIIRGFGEGDVVKITPAADVWTDKVGADGEVTRSWVGDQRAEIEIILAPGSDAIDIMQTLMTSDALTKVATFRFLFADTRGNSSFTAPDCWIVANPERAFGNEAKDVTYKLKAGHMNFKNGSSFQV